MGCAEQAQTANSLYASIIPTAELEISQWMYIFKGPVVNDIVIIYETVKHLQDL